MTEQVLVRIKPSNRRESHTIICGGASYPITKDRGWQSVPAFVAAIAATERMNDMSDESPFVFDVKDAEEASRIVAAETRRVDPAGTPDKPHVVQPAVMADPMEEPQAARRRARSA